MQSGGKAAHHVQSSTDGGAVINVWWCALTLRPTVAPAQPVAILARVIESGFEKPQLGCLNQDRN
ncbi:hypothetical protein QC764_606250 [Podospora pseudoanserina]|uniref:Uncharacterized protein n=1 Tax=Podospora pseudoanserina TaxID=2609844 RepID=A0ABR0HUS6_9PEZI|nr:hypothetical protein QC764_606250 [Podospora pseudoanserina]